MTGPPGPEQISRKEAKAATAPVVQRRECLHRAGFAPLRIRRAAATATDRSTLSVIYRPG